MLQDIGSLAPLTTVEQPDEPPWGEIASSPHEQLVGLATPAESAFENVTDCSEL